VRVGPDGVPAGGGTERLVADAVLVVAARERREEMDTFAKAIAAHLSQIFAG
jgi:hypothetical protein